MNWVERLRTECDRTSQRDVAARMGASQAVLCKLLLDQYPSDTAWLETKFEAAFGSNQNWLAALRAEVARTSGARTALRLGISEATVSQVLSGKYAADTQRIARRVRGALLGETVECPVALEMPMHKCQEIQDRKAGSFGNPVYARAQLCCRGRGEFADKGVCRHACGPAAGNQSKEIAS
jgi:predicted transcriptional regulator